jgi:hypothetical protein
VRPLYAGAAALLVAGVGIATLLLLLRTPGEGGEAARSSVAQLPGLAAPAPAAAPLASALESQPAAETPSKALAVAARASPAQAASTPTPEPALALALPRVSYSGRRDAVIVELRRLESVLQESIPRTYLASVEEALRLKADGSVWRLDRRGQETDRVGDLTEDQVQALLRYLVYEVSLLKRPETKRISQSSWTFPQPYSISQNLSIWELGVFVTEGAGVLPLDQGDSSLAAIWTQVRRGLLGQ